MIGQINKKMGEYIPTAPPPSPHPHKLHPSYSLFSSFASHFLFQSKQQYICIFISLVLVTERIYFCHDKNDHITQKRCYQSALLHLFCHCYNVFFFTMPRNLFITLRNASMVRTTIGHHVNLNMKRRELPSHVRVVHKSDGCSDYIVSVLINLQGYNKCRSIRFQVGVVVVLPRQIKSP